MLDDFIESQCATHVSQVSGTGSQLFSQQLPLQHWAKALHWASQNKGLYPTEWPALSSPDTHIHGPDRTEQNA